MIRRFLVFGLILLALGVLTVSRFVKPWDDDEPFGGTV